jgi:hypothetical protein
MLWIARDERVFSEDPVPADAIPDIAEFTEKPTKDKQTGMWYGEGARDLPREMYPDLAPGECRELRMVDESASTPTETCE